jgi:hypothetical protein
MDLLLCVIILILIFFVINKKIGEPTVRKERQKLNLDHINNASSVVCSNFEGKKEEERI